MLTPGEYRGKVVLVTGASGFLGRPLAEALAAAGAEVHALSRKPPREETAGIQWHPADLARSGWADSLPSKPWTHLFHLANPSVLDLEAPLEDYLRIDVAATEALVALSQSRGAHLVVTGSGSVYAPSERPHREGDPLSSPTAYTKGKLACERLLAAEAARAPFPWTLVRLFGVYGPREAPGRLMPTVIRALGRGETARLSAGTQVRDLLFLEDAVSAFLALGALPANPEGRTLNVGSGQGRSVREMAESVAARMGGPGRLAFGAPSSRPHDCPRWVADIGRVRQATSWSPRVSWEEGLDRTIRWWRERDGA